METLKTYYLSDEEFMSKYDTLSSNDIENVKIVKKIIENNSDMRFLDNEFNNFKIELSKIVKSSVSNEGLHDCSLIIHKVRQFYIDNVINSTYLFSSWNNSSKNETLKKICEIDHNCDIDYCLKKYSEDFERVYNKKRNYMIRFKNSIISTFNAKSTEDREHTEYCTRFLIDRLCLNVDI